MRLFSLSVLASSSHPSESQRLQSVQMVRQSPLFDMNNTPNRSQSDVSDVLDGHSFPKPIQLDGLAPVKLALRVVVLMPAAFRKCCGRDEGSQDRSTATTVPEPTARSDYLERALSKHPLRARRKLAALLVRRMVPKEPAGKNAHQARSKKAWRASWAVGSGRSQDRRCKTAAASREGGPTN